MNQSNTNGKIQNTTDAHKNKEVEANKFAKVSKVKPLSFLNHVHKSIGKKNQLPSVLIFFATSRCNLSCSHCFYHDSLNKRFNELSLDEIDTFTKTMDPLLHLIITGGEPLMWNLDKLTNALKNKGLKVHLETSGAYPISGSFDWICLSPKKMQFPLDEIKPIVNEFKVIINNKHDFDWAETQREGLSDNCKLYLQAEWSKREKVIPLIIAFIKENKHWAISLQSHKYMNIP